MPRAFLIDCTSRFCLCLYIAGQKIFGQGNEDKDRDNVVARLNDPSSSMHGVVMSEKVGACGLNLVGASHIIFVGSLHSQDFENQAIGTSTSLSVDLPLTLKQADFAALAKNINLTHGSSGTQHFLETGCLFRQKQLEVRRMQS